MTVPTPRVVLIEDDAPIRRFVVAALGDAGLHVHEAETGRRGLIECATRKPDLVILDLGLPDGDGVKLLPELRSWSQVPVLVLSARGEEAQKVAALDAGADDYLSKPFGMAELLARARALLRRAHRSADDATAEVRLGAVTVHLGERRVWNASTGDPIHLTPIEYRLLTVLLGQRGRVLTHRQLLTAVWGPHHVEHPHYLRVHMQSLRRKLEADPARPQHLLTEIGVGYRLVE